MNSSKNLEETNITGIAICERSQSFARVFLRANLPTFTAYILGTMTLSTYCVLGAAVYALYCVASTVMMWGTVCTNCPFYGKICPCGYSVAATALFKQGNPKLISSRYRLIWVYVAPSWLVPPITTMPVLLWHFSWLPLFLVVAFIVVAYVAAPALSDVLGCCPFWRGCPIIPGETGLIGKGGSSRR